MYSPALVFRQTTSLGSLVINATARRRKKPKIAPLRIPDKRMVVMSRWYVLMRTGLEGTGWVARARGVVRAVSDEGKTYFRAFPGVVAG